MSSNGVIMTTLIQKKVSITDKQKQFLENYKKWGFSDQSSIIREALNLFISELETREKLPPLIVFKYGLYP